eukprot:gene32341-41905_t
MFLPAGIRATTPRKNKTFESTVFLGPDPNAYSPRQNRTYESSLFKDPSELVPESPSRPAKRACGNSPKTSIGSVFSSAKKESSSDNHEAAGIAYQSLSNSTSKLWSKRPGSRTFQSSLFEDETSSRPSSPRSAKKLVNSAPKTNIGDVFDRSSNQENIASQSNIRPSKKSFVDQSTVQKVFEKNEPTKHRPSKKLAADKSSMNLVIAQVKSTNSPRVRGSPGGPTAICLC